MRVKLLKYHKVWDQSPGPRRSKNQSMFEQISPQRSFIPVFPEIVGCPWKGGIPEKSRKYHFYPLSVLKIMNKHEIWRFPISEKPSCMLWLPLCPSIPTDQTLRGAHQGFPTCQFFQWVSWCLGVAARDIGTLWNYGRWTPNTLWVLKGALEYHNV